MSMGPSQRSGEAPPLASPPVWVSHRGCTMLGETVCLYPGMFCHLPHSWCFPKNRVCCTLTSAERSQPLLKRQTGLLPPIFSLQSWPWAEHCSNYRANLDNKSKQVMADVRLWKLLRARRETSPAPSLPANLPYWVQCVLHTPNSSFQFTASVK